MASRHSILSTISFDIPGIANQYLDIHSSALFGKVRIVKRDGKALTSRQDFLQGTV